ncbi:MAG: hypothetical protein AAB622_02635 [Patescibacteria group bacterium]
MSTLKLINRLRELDIKFLTPTILARILETDNKNSVYKSLNRLQKNGVLQNLDKGKFLVSGSNATDFEIANFIVYPSYVSLESALSFYGILPQFPYSITSATTQRSKKIEYNNKNYEYVKISNKLFFGYLKSDDFLIASKEKALVDYLYLASKGLKNTDISEWDLSSIDKSTFNEICSTIKFSPFQKLIKKYDWQH